MILIAKVSKEGDIAGVIMYKHRQCKRAIKAHLNNGENCVKLVYFKEQSKKKSFLKH